MLRCIIPWSFCVFVLWNKNCYSCSQTLRIWPSSISLFKTVANICAFLLSFLNQKFVFWSLPRSSHFNPFFGAFVSSLSEIGLQSILGFFSAQVFHPVGCFITYPFTTYFQEFSISSLVDALFTLVFDYLGRLENFLQTVLYFDSIGFVFSCRQTIVTSLLNRFNHFSQIFFLLYVIFLK